MEPMKVLHLASFNGNIGDNANHSGFRPWLERLAGRRAEWTDLEIREYYWKERKFDETFVRLVSGFDLVVIGGGNYFELWVERSATGTSIDIPLDILAQIKTPMFFNALGCDEGQGVTEASIGKFTRFLEVLVRDPRFLVSVRNDGAMKTLRKHVPSALADKVHAIPDGGFFLEHKDSDAPYLKPAKKRIGINLASDMAEIRFRNFGDADGYGRFCDEFAAMLGSLAESDPGIHFVFFPHIFRDLAILSDVIDRLGDRLRRTRVSMAPYVNGAEGAKHVFGLYRKCDLFLGMRFHANVCALGLGVPAIGLCNYPQIDFLYEEINHPGGRVSVREPGFSVPLRKLIDASLSGEAPGGERERIMRDIARSRANFEPVLSGWLRMNSLVVD
jgi:polysaccharide pyruvyl transferase WcaK-like protein